MSGNAIGARKSDEFKAVCTAPSLNKTPAGAAMVVLAYPTTQDLSNCISTAGTVNFNLDPVVLLDRSKQPNCKGDDPGSGTGIFSGTVNGEVKPTGASSTVRCEGKQVVRQNDPNTMNGGNNPGIYITTQSPSSTPAKTAAGSSNPPVEPETPQEQSAIGKWWDKTKAEIGEAVNHPWEGTKGAVKDLLNTPSHLAEAMAKAEAEKYASRLDVAAYFQNAVGLDQAAQSSTQAAARLRASGNAIDLPKFSMSNPAQSGGATISSAVQILAGGVGIVKGLAKGAVKGISALGKGGAKVETQAATAAVKSEPVIGGTAAADDVAKTTGQAKTTGAAQETAQATQSAAAEVAPAGDGVKVVTRVKSLREQYLGRTPGKNSRTGKEVQERMRDQDKLRDGPNGTEFKASDGEWYPLKDADMAHNKDAVTWWNDEGRKFGAKSPEVRKWMLDSKNYTLDHYSINRSLGAKLTDRYLPPLK